MTEPSSRRDTIMATVSDLLVDFLYYERKEDESLPVGAIEEAIRAGEVSIEEIVGAFQEGLTRSVHGD